MPKKPQTPTPDQIAKARVNKIRALYLVFLLIGIGVLCRIVWLQYGPLSQQLQNSEETQFNDVLTAQRGNVYSDDGRLMATSIPYYELRMDLCPECGPTSRRVEIDPKADTIFTAQAFAELGQALAAFFGDKSAAQYTQELIAARAAQARSHLVTPIRVNYIDLQKVKQFPLFRLGRYKSGLTPTERYEREHPYGSLARRSLGETDGESKGRTGIELSFEEILRGSPGLVVRQRGAGRKNLPVFDENNIDPVHGYDLMTTINVELQDMVQGALQQWVSEARAEWGCAIVMEVATGDIKAISNVTRSATGEILPEIYNYAIGQRMEPGSTFKLPVLMAFYDDARLSPAKMINTEDGKATTTDGVEVSDSHHGGYGIIPLEEVFEVSSNIGMAKAALEVYPYAQRHRFLKALERTSILEPLGLQLIGEKPPTHANPDNPRSWTGSTTNTMTRGYAVEVSPIQTLALYNAVANGGRKVKPMIVRELRNKDRVIERYETEILDSAVCSSTALAYVRRALEGVVTHGTAMRLFQGAPYTIAAKTGTARVAIGGRYEQPDKSVHYLASLAGYMPADKPRYSLIVVLQTHYYEGSKKPYYGADLSGPIFRKMADYIYLLNNNFQQPVATRRQAYAPALRALPGPSSQLSELMRMLGVGGVPAAVGAMADVQVALDSGRVVTLSPMVAGAGGVPDLRGMTLPQALRLSEEVGLRPVFEGMGTVVSQSLEPGTPYDPGDRITVQLSVNQKINTGLPQEAL